ncbi:MAG TPA: glycoside hydrolase family 130 protein [Pseudonocardiaceae bacterium]
MIAQAPGLVTRHPVLFDPDPRRVITKLFVPGEEIPETRSRTSAVLQRTLALPESSVDALLDGVLADFAVRHRDFTAILERNAAIMSNRIADPDGLSRNRRLLIGAVFTHEYAVEAAALCNPSLVPHPSQDVLAAGEVRVVLSLRGIGEGHLSSIGFATGVLGPGPSARWEPRIGPLVTAERQPDSWDGSWFRAALAHDGCDEITFTVLSSLPESFDQADLDHALASLHPRLLQRPRAPGTVRRIRELAAASYTVRFPDGTDLPQRILWPTSAAESHGMEDARFVQVVDPDGTASYRATYTACDGTGIAPHVLESSDLTSFRALPLTGPAARNKGMALFPRLVGGRHLALCRGDGETTSLSISPDGRNWAEGVTLHGPTAPWELLQVGNCGSPLETSQGWLVLTHGVGPMRTYAIGAVLLDLTDPTRILAALPEPLLVPEASERDGYVPNVVYSCGGMLHDGTLWLPYGSSDTRVAMATVQLDALLARMGSSHPG